MPDAPLHPAIAEEEDLLRRVLGALETKAPPSRGAASISTDELRALRDEAVTARDDDSVAVLHELAVQQTLRARRADRTSEAGPDPGSPYLAHLRIREGERARDYLLGQATFIDAASGIRIVDWRVAPVAQIFYRYREGDTFEESFPGRDVRGVVELRRALVIHRGRLVQIVGGDFALFRRPDGTWAEEERSAFALSPGGAGTAARAGSLGVGAGARDTRMDVTALLDADQFRAIRSPADEPLLVLGSAGSGKTTVALHRLASLSAKDPERYPIARARVVVPEEGLARLSARLLAPIGGGEAQVRTLDDAAIAFARSVFGKLPPLCFDPPALVSGLKRHPALFDALRARMRADFGRSPHPAGPVWAKAGRLDQVRGGSAGARASQGSGVPHPRPQDVSGRRPDGSTRSGGAAGARASQGSGEPTQSLRALRKELADLFTDRGFLGRVVEASGGTLPVTAIEETVQHTLRQLAAPLDRMLATITDEERKQAIDGRRLAEGTPDDLAGSVDVEELPILLAILSWRGGLRLPEVSHLVLDEAEDFSLFDLEALAGLVRHTGRATLAGDEAQQTHSSFAGWERSLETLGIGEAAVCRLPISYRCPRPIAELAREVLGPLAPQAPARASREGAPVGRFGFPDEAQAHLFLAGALQDLLEREPRASVALIASDAATARRFYTLVQEVTGSRLVRNGEFSFEPGLDVTDVDQVKGLEWDYVIVPDANAAVWPATDDGRRRLHVAITRASHQLWLVSSGAPSPLVADERK
ncbi:MAG TPA: ATP-binding domain-containing protein [Vulgatibacter sp.]